MSFITVIEPPTKLTFEAQYFTKSEKVGDIPITVFPVDATVREVYSQSARMTDINVENGAIINDHIIVSPPELEIEGIISDTPVDLNPNPFSTFASGITDIFTDAESFVTPSKVAYDFFRVNMAAKRKFNITTGRDFYKDYYITSLRMPLSENTGRALEFSCRMKKMTIVYLDGAGSGAADTKTPSDEETEAVEGSEK